MFIKLYFWSQFVLIMHLFQTKFWNQLIRIWHRPTAFQEIAMGFNIWSMTHLSIMSLLIGRSPFLSLWNVNNFCNSQEHSIAFAERWSLFVLRMDSMFSFLRGAAQMQCATGSVVPRYRRGHWRTALYLQQSSCILLEFQSVTKKNPNKTLLQIKHMRNKSLDILPTMNPKLPQNLRTT